MNSAVPRKRATARDGGGALDTGEGGGLFGFGQPSRGEVHRGIIARGLDRPLREDGSFTAAVPLSYSPLKRGIITLTERIQRYHSTGCDRPVRTGEDS